MSQAANLSAIERVVSAALGVMLLERALVRRVRHSPPLGRLVLGAAGVEFIRRGVSGYCAISDLVGRSAQPVRARRPSSPRQYEPEAITDPVDRDSADSFPASDPPSWTPMVGP